MENVKELYGIEPMTFEEEMNLWKEHAPIAKTRNNKKRLVLTFEKLRNIANYMIDYSKTIPEEDIAEHARLVEKLTLDVIGLTTKIDDTIYHDIYGK